LLPSVNADAWFTSRPRSLTLRDTVTNEVPVARLERSVARACAACESHLRLAPCFILVAAARDPQIQVELSVKLWARVVVGEYLRELF
jgi:hypothetical protein